MQMDCYTLAVANIAFAASASATTTNTVAVVADVVVVVVVVVVIFQSIAYYWDCYIAYAVDTDKLDAVAANVVAKHYN